MSTRKTDLLDWLPIIVSLALLVGMIAFIFQFWKAVGAHDQFDMILYGFLILFCAEGGRRSGA